MATQTLANADAILKNAYRGTIVELLNQKTYIIDQLEKANANNLGSFTGRQLMFAVHSSRNRGRGATTDGGTLVNAGFQGSLDGIVSLRYFDQGIELTQQVIEQTKTDEGAFVRAMDFEMSGAMKDLRKDVNRQAYGTGDGVLANCTATQSSTTFSVDTGQYIAVGDTVDVLTKSNGTVKGSALTVSAVAYTGTAGTASQANANITVSSSVSVTSADAVYITGSRNLESDGLRNICNTNRTLHQINSGTNPIWDSNLISAANSNPSEDMFMQLAQKILQRIGEPLDVFVTTYGVQRRLANTYASQKRWDNANVLSIDGGYSAIMVAAGGPPCPVVADVDAPNGTAFGLNKSSFAWAESGPADWLEAPDDKGSIFTLKDSSTAQQKLFVWQAWVKWFAALVCVAPLKNGQITSINDDIPIARV